MKKNIIKVAILLVIATTLCTLTACGRRPNNQDTTEIPVLPEYRSVRGAVYDGTIRKGMTYEEIVEICGEPSSTIKSNGYVSSAYYYGGDFVLRFDYGVYNGRYTEY
jgi:hypothetical protein